MLKIQKGFHQKNLDYQKNPEFWENFSAISSKILELLKNTGGSPEYFGLKNPSKINIKETSFVSLFLYQISENPLLQDRELDEFSGKEKCFRSENILHFMITIHSDDHVLELNSMEKFLGIIYSNPKIKISNSLSKPHLKINFVDRPIDVWNNLFPSEPYRNSILLTVHGSGVIYSHSETSEKNGLYSYGSAQL
ncbi:MAG: hypothetical protein PVI88_05760 [Nitrosopumilaceae archaeon]|jgi:hypothetical protein